jgi:transcriptional regulator with XRE-family HTH domain
MANSQKWSEEVRRAIGDRSQRQIAFKIGVSPGTLSNMLMGRIPEDIGVVRRFAEVQEAQANPQSIRRYQQIILEQWGNMSGPERREFLRVIAPRIEVYPDKLILCTSLSIGNIEVQTDMFVETGDNEHDPSDNSSWLGAPGRTNGDISPRRFELSNNGRQRRKSN